MKRGGPYEKVIRVLLPLRPYTHHCVFLKRRVASWLCGSLILLLRALNREFPALDARIPFSLILSRRHVGFYMNLLTDLQPRKRLRVATVLTRDLCHISSVRDLERDSCSCPRTSWAHTGLEWKDGNNLPDEFNRHILVNLLCIPFKFLAILNLLAVLFDKFPVGALRTRYGQIAPRKLFRFFISIQ